MIRGTVKPVPKKVWKKYFSSLGRMKEVALVNPVKRETE
jgi:hypothetical protein